MNERNSSFVIMATPLWFHYSNKRTLLTVYHGALCSFLTFICELVRID
jgi:hypothetical protein